MDKKVAPTLGETLRELRLQKGIKLRDMAKRLGVTPTYLSQVEQDKFSVPTEERIRQIGEEIHLPLLQVDRLVMMAGRTPRELFDILVEQPEMANFLRAARGLPTRDIQQLTDDAEQRKKKGQPPQGSYVSDRVPSTPYRKRG